MFITLHLDIRITIFKLSLFWLLIVLVIFQLGIQNWIEISLYIVGAAISAVLTGFSISAYRKTGLHKLQYTIVAFSLFCVFLIYENIEHLFLFESPITDIIIPSTGLVILALFFMSVVRKTWFEVLQCRMELTLTIFIMRKIE